MNTLYAHPDGAGTIEAGKNSLYCCNDLDATFARIEIGPDGLRALAIELLKVADVIEGAQQ